MKMQENIRILVVDDHVMVRTGLVTLLADQPDFLVVGQARLGEEAGTMFEELLPDITLIDGCLPDVHGTEVIRRVLAKHPDAAFIMVSIHETAEDIHIAMEAGARAYVPKSHDQDVILDAIREVAAGRIFLPGDLAVKLAGRSFSAGLSQREIEVLTLIARGKANKEIADELHLSANTVKTHVARILAKLHAPDRTRAVTLAIERGVVRL